MKYQPNKKWDRHRPEFLKIGFILSLTFVLMAFNYTTPYPKEESYSSGEPIEIDVLVTPPITNHPKPIPAPPAPIIETVSAIDPIDEPLFVEEKIVTQKVDFVKTSTDEAYPTQSLPETAPIVAPIIFEPEENSGPVPLAERMPIYGSCNLDDAESIRRACTESNLIEHIYSNVRYPALAKEHNREGTVFVSFVVNKQGEVINVEILRDIGMGCGDEVKRVIKKLGVFLPGKQNGRPVSVVYRLPVKFTLMK